MQVHWAGQEKTRRVGGAIFAKNHAPVLLREGNRENCKEQYHRVVDFIQSLLASNHR